ncbi:MAG TPA: glycoside hydrolase family 3 protein [Candidatus Pullilachnospira stercoravium]|uniref:Glycoside hydrolase family 3 protein n=1 Tax=Candidatus Pullilachnospira stercoravium TaxID=2840913 RepID=A0A9D1NX36_9FIRM|nr:glycoside hydrolase family 3 protein [Candidatus Pullilachnospira stercoravium]
MERWGRAWYQPCLPLGGDGTRVTGSQEHIQLSRQAAREGMVLLKNQGRALPLEKGAKLALFGKATMDYVKGGGGSGDVTVAYTRNLYEGLKTKEPQVQILEPLADFYRENVSAQYAQGVVPGFTREPKIPEELLTQAKAWTDTAVISICRFSGEGWDRKGIPGDGDFYLTKEEQEMVETVTGNFDRVIVVLNVGGMVDTSWFFANDRIQAVLLAWQGGIEGGLAAADLLCGEVSPSGKLTDTFAVSFDDYPSSEGFNESEDYVEYTEDIYVGYRYFETISGAAGKVNYPFGYGLSYTSFSREYLGAFLEDGVISVDVRVTNIGGRPGKEVVQLYYGAPQGKLGKPAKELGAFGKTRLLEAGDSQVMRLTMREDSMASYDDLGKVKKSAYVLEAGIYRFWLGGSVREAKEIPFFVEKDEAEIVAQYSEKCAPRALKRRLLSDGTFEEMPQRPERERVLGLAPQDVDKLEGVIPAVLERKQVQLSQPPAPGTVMLADVAEGKATLDQLIAQLTDEELAELLGGQPNTGVANTYGMGNIPDHRVPNIMTADGPAGLRIQPQCGVCTTAWPCATLLACSWNEDLVYQVGAAGAAEVKENNIGIWLTPAMNIHRSPLCGRNFEYYSEDPLVAGKMGAAMIRGIQSQHIGASMKHFACNNKETNRKASDSRVSERAMREIYLKGFEIAVKEAQPWTIMSSYNLINGCHASENRELLTDILRDEWGFEGAVTTDWWTFAEHYLETKAGNDIKMGCGYPDRLLEALEKGLITRKEMEICGRRILELILKFD